jgi:transcriptional regulator with XRE-family HTH domain
VVASNFVKSFGKRVRTLRELRGMSQEALADRAGLHRTAISLIETAKRGSTLDTIEKLARALSVEPAELMPTLESKRRVAR